jgi:V/A-type H+-transporting ATPase subunit G/H
LSRTDILTEIKQAEAEADAKVAKAEEEQKAALAEARRDSVKKIQDAEAQMRSSYESAVAAEKDKLAKEHDSKIVQGKQEAENIDSGSKAKKEEAKDFLKNEVERILNVSS